MKTSHVLIILAVVTLWGFNFVVIRVGLDGLPPILFTALRFILAALPLVFFIPRPAVSWGRLAAYAFFQFALQFTLLFSGMKLGFPPGLASLVIQLQAFFTIGLAVVALKERPRLAQLLGSFIALGAMALIAARLDVGSTGVGFLLVIGAGLSWGIANILIKKIGHVDPLALVVWGSLLAGPPLLAVSLFVEGPAAWVKTAERLNWLSVGAVLFQSYANTIAGFGCWSMLLRKYPATTVAPFALLVPITGLLSSALFLNEPLQSWKIMAAALVLSGLTLNQIGARSRVTVPPTE